MLDGKAAAQARVIDDVAQERGFALGVSRHVIAVSRCELPLECLVSAGDLGVMDEPVAEQELVLDWPRGADDQVQMMCGA